MNQSLIYTPEPKRPHVPQTSYRQQYEALAKTDDARPIGAAYGDIAQAIKCMDENAEQNAAQRYTYDRNEAER